LDTRIRVAKLSETFDLDSFAELVDSITSNLESISQFAGVEMDIPSTDRTNNPTVRLYPTDRLVKLVGLVGSGSSTVTASLPIAFWLQS
jgi:hypothetical protein